MAWCVSYSSLEAVDWSGGLYKLGGEGVNNNTVFLIVSWSSLPDFS